MTSLHRMAVVPPVLLGAALLWFAATPPAPPEAVPSETRVPVSYVTATPRAFAPKVSGYGTVSPARVWTAVAEVAGPIDHLHPAFKRGGFITEGDVLAAIAPDDYELALAAAEAELKTAEARVTEMKVTERTTKASLQIERESLEFAESDLARTMRLTETGVVSEAVLETRRRDVLTQRSKVQNLENTLALLPSQIDALEQSVAAAWFAKMSAELDVARTFIKAPFDARVAQADVEINQFVGVGAKIGVLDGVEAVEVDVQVSQQRMAELVALRSVTPFGVSGDDDSTSNTGVWPGVQPVPAHWVDGPYNVNATHLTARIHQGDRENGASWSAEVVRTSGEVDSQTRAMGVILRVTEPSIQSTGRRPSRLLKGMFVRADLYASTMKDMILLPRAAIRDGRVMVIDADDRLAYASAEPVFTADDVVVLRHGALPEGARVVTSEPSPAIEGLLLAPQPDLTIEALLQALSEGDEQ